MSEKKAMEDLAVLRQRLIRLSSLRSILGLGVTMMPSTVPKSNSGGDE